MRLSESRRSSPPAGRRTARTSIVVAALATLSSITACSDSNSNEARPTIVSMIGSLKPVPTTVALSKVPPPTRSTVSTPPTTAAPTTTTQLTYSIEKRAALVELGILGHKDLGADWVTILPGRTVPDPRSAPCLELAPIQWGAVGEFSATLGETVQYSPSGTSLTSFARAFDNSMSADNWLEVMRNDEVGECRRQLFARLLQLSIPDLVLQSTTRPIDPPGQALGPVHQTNHDLLEFGGIVGFTDTRHYRVGNVIIEVQMTHSGELTREQVQKLDAHYGPAVVAVQQRVKAAA